MVYYSALHYAAKAKKSEEIAAEYLQQIGNKVTAVEGSIGDIGIAPLGIDEAQNKRRYLNGQVISQAQFVSFTNKLKSIIQTYPSLATSETNWQAEVTNSKLGQCGKFVIDDEAGTIRLPKVVNINGLQDLSLLGGIKAESLPNITGSFATQNDAFRLGTGAFADSGNTTRYTAGINSGGNGANGESFDASRSSSTYQENAPVQQEAVQYPYFIQVATGVEESVDVTREIELNNPFFFGMSQWFESKPNNASWLISNSSYHSGATYVDFYEWLLKIHNGTLTVDGVSVKAYGASDITDYDYVINTADTTFRLPLLDGSETVPDVDKIQNWELLASGTNYRIARNGWLSVSLVSGAANKIARILNNSSKEGMTATSVSTGDNLNLSCFGRKGETISLTYYTSGGANSFTFTPAKGNGSLYFYVGETIQDANVIAASQVLTDIANLKNYDYVVDYYPKTDEEKEAEATAGTHHWYRIYKSGWIEQGGTVSPVATNNTVTFLKPFKERPYVSITRYSTYGGAITTASYWINGFTAREETFFRFSADPSYNSTVLWQACGQGE